MGYYFIATFKSKVTGRKKALRTKGPEYGLKTTKDVRAFYKKLKMPKSLRIVSIKKVIVKKKRK